MASGLCSGPSCPHPGHLSAAEVPGLSPCPETHKHTQSTSRLRDDGNTPHDVGSSLNVQKNVEAVERTTAAVWDHLKPIQAEYSYISLYI